MITRFSPPIFVFSSHHCFLLPSLTSSSPSHSFFAFSSHLPSLAFFSHLWLRQSNKAKNLLKYYCGLTRASPFHPPDAPLYLVRLGNQSSLWQNSYVEDWPSPPFSPEKVARLILKPYVSLERCVLEAEVWYNLQFTFNQFYTDLVILDKVRGLRVLTLYDRIVVVVVNFRAF